jgi:DNA-binding response OmpR family regulator
MAEKILIVDDELSLQETLAYNLKKQGYEVEIASEGSDALEIARHTHPDLILLDIMLPGIDGFEVCRILRREMNTPVLMLTARDDEIDRVVGLEVGADDYLVKPFSMRELLARIKAMLRRVRLIRDEYTVIPQSEKSAEIIEVDTITIDLGRKEIRLRNVPVSLKPKEYDLLVFLAQHPNRALSREYILQQVWGWNYYGDSRTVDVHIRWLREKIESNPTKPRHIVTIRGTGYRFDS